MVRSGAARSALTWTVAGLGVLDLSTAAVLSVAAASQANGVIHVSHSRGGLGASLGLLAMTAPVAIRRMFPLTAAGILAAGAVANGLSGYRIVEHLLAVFDDTPHSAIDVGLRFGQDALEVRVSGPSARGADLAAVMAAASERAVLYGGSVHGSVADGRCVATAWLPSISGHA